MCGRISQRGEGNVTGHRSFIGGAESLSIEQKRRPSPPRTSGTRQDRCWDFAGLHRSSLPDTKTPSVSPVRSKEHVRRILQVQLPSTAFGAVPMGSPAEYPWAPSASSAWTSRADGTPPVFVDEGPARACGDVRQSHQAYPRSPEAGWPYAFGAFGTSSGAMQHDDVSPQEMVQQTGSMGYRHAFALDSTPFSSASTDTHTEYILGSPMAAPLEPPTVPPTKPPVRSPRKPPAAAAPKLLGEPQCFDCDGTEQATWEEDADDQELPRTTLMVQNIPRRIKREDFLQALAEQGFDGTYDYFYLPRSFHTSSNKGYAFLNFTEAEVAGRFKRTFNMSLLLGTDKRSRQKTLRVTDAAVQGKRNNLLVASSKKMTRIRNTSCRPMVL